MENAKSLHCHLKVKELQLKNNSTLEEIARLIESQVDKNICIVNNNLLRFYDDKELPLQNIRLEKKVQDQYFFQDIITNELITVFSYNTAKKFFPNLKENEKNEKFTVKIKEEFKFFFLEFNNRKILLSENS
jgi:hypothetical protein